MNPFHTQETEPGVHPLNDLQLLPPDQAAPPDWFELGRQPVMLLLGQTHQQLKLVYRRGAANPLTSVETFASQSPPDRRLWSRAQSPEFRSAAKNSSPDAHALWLRRGSSHPPLRRLALISGHWSDTTASDWIELRSQWRMVRFNFSDTGAEFVFLAFSTR